MPVEDRCSAAHAWLARQGWTAFDFQQQVWQAMADGESGLLHATTGAGKTLAVWLGALLRGADGGRAAPPLAVLWITPMRALAGDTHRALQAPMAALQAGWTLGLRTGDTPSAERARQDRRLPTALVTTPESMSLLLSRADAPAALARVRTVIVDEWHELLATKRGVQVQLALARLRALGADLVVWGLSATLGDPGAALQALLPAPASDAAGAAGPGRLVQGRIDKDLQVDTLLPADPGRFCWAGHLGTQMLAPVVAEIEASGSTLVFTNVRSQAEIWYQLLLQARPDWAGQIALHHGSLDAQVRAWVEAGLREGRLKAVVATSSLDLGVDFQPVERVLQIGSAKGIARLLQRAGRSGHQPGRRSRVTLVPTHTLELVEAAAVRRAIAEGRIESRHSPDQPLDVLVQHLVTVALGGGFQADALYQELRRCWAYRQLGRAAFDWALGFASHGGDSLGAYPDYHRIRAVDGRWCVTDRAIAQRHRLQIGTIVSEASVRVQWLTGGTLGQVEEGFIARLKPGDHFVFAGRVLEFVRAREMTAYVRRPQRRQGLVPAWAGGKMPLSSELADCTLAMLQAAAQGGTDAPEMQAAAPMLETQARLSRLPQPGRLLLEHHRSREGHHVFLYPFAGRQVHLGVASLLAWRLARSQANSFSISVNDYGFELLARDPLDLQALRDGTAWQTDRLRDDLLASLNASEMARRRFREIARVAGLVFNGYPGAPRSLRQLQASSSLLYDVFRRYDAGNLLLSQAEHEVLAQELELPRLQAALQALAQRPLDEVTLAAPSPFCLPLMVERFREQLSTEKLQDRLARLLADAQAVLEGSAPAGTRRRGPRAGARPARP